MKEYIVRTYKVESYTDLKIKAENSEEAKRKAKKKIKDELNIFTGVKEPYLYEAFLIGW